MHHYDLLVIGAGSGGVRAARMAASRYGKRVAVVERARLGGTCVNLGCIPKKLFHYAAGYANAFREATGYGWQQGSAPQFTWSQLVAAVQAEIARLNEVYAGLLQQAGVEIVHGHGSVLDGHTVQVGTRKLTASRILVATGGTPWLPDIPGKELAITSDQFFTLPALPASAIVVGGGYIAVELAGILQGLGCQTRIVHRGDGVLRGFDEDVRRHLHAQMTHQGITFHLSRNVSRVEQNDASLQVTLDDGQSLESACVLYATGRKPALAGLGLENTLVRLTDSGQIAVNAQLQTDEPSIYALGDVVGHKELTPVALAEAMWLLDQWYGDGRQPPVDYGLVPSAVFSQPEVGTVGLSEAAARKLHGEAVTIYRSEFRPLRHVVSGLGERILMKLVVQSQTGQVLGLHMVGAEAGEIIQGFAVALAMGVTKDQLDRTLGIHPTAAEEFVTMRSPVA